MKLIKWIGIATVLVGTSLWSQDLISGLKIKDQGHFSIAGLDAGIKIFDDKWNICVQDAKTVQLVKGSPQKKSAKWELTAVLNTSSGAALQLSETFERNSATEVTYQANLEGANAKYNSISVSFDLPVAQFKAKNIEIDGKKILLPDDFSGEQTILSAKADNITLPLATGKLVLSGKLNVLIQDNRKYKSDTFEIRLSFSPATGAISKTSIAFSASLTPFESSPLDLSSAVNMGFKDDVGGDHLGGWTDQGAENDLGMITPGESIFLGLRFRILDPNKNNGKSCLVFAGPSRDYFLKEADIPGDNKSYSYLYLLHAIAWPPGDKVSVGKIKVHYAGGEKSEMDIVRGRDVNDWWAPMDLTNGAVVWSSTNKSSFVGLYVSKIQIQNKPIQSVHIEGTGKAVWMVVGLTASSADVSLSSGSLPVYIVAGEKWAPLTWSETSSAKPTIVKDSVMDFSFLGNESGAPAGKYGPVVVRNGRFEFENRPGVHSKFYGANLCFTANYLEKKDADSLAELLASEGYNSMRIHHHDRFLSDNSADSSMPVNERNWDRLDYLLYSLKQKGMYVTTDLFVSRTIKVGEVPEINRPMDQKEFKALAMVLPSAMENWKHYAKLFLEHVNPYTKLAWKDDPALFALSLINEDPLPSVWNSSPEVKVIVLKRFDEWKKSHNLSANLPEMESARYFSKFLIETHIAAYREMSTYLKSLGVKIPLTDANMVETVELGFLRDEMDYVDNHHYWDHPSFLEKNWSKPFLFRNDSALNKLGRMVPQMPSRVFGKPFMITEFQYVFPNPYRAQGGAIYPAYAALQGWDGLYRFDFGDSSIKITDFQRAAGFSQANDPISFLSEKIGLLFFLRGDVKPAEKSFPYLLSDKYFLNPSTTPGAQFSESYSQLGAYAKVGTIVLKDGEKLNQNHTGFSGSLKPESGLAANQPWFKSDDDLHSKLISANLANGEALASDKKRITSDTGELLWSADRGVFRANTPKTECVVLPEGNLETGNVLQAKSEEGWNLFSISSLDNQDLTSSRRMILIHLTDIANTKTKFRDKSKRVLEEDGTLPWLVAYGKVSLTLKLKNAESLKLWGCDLSGKRVEEIAVQKSATGLSFTAETIKNKKAKYLVYELAEK